MEKIFKPRYKNLINIKNKFTEYKQNLCPASINRLPENFDEIKTLLDITSEAEEELVENLISLDHLAQIDDIRINDFHLQDLHRVKRVEKVEIPKKAMRLRCIRNRVKYQAESNADDTKSKPRKYNRYNYLKLEYDNFVGACDLLPLDEIYILVRIYEPFVYKRGASVIRKPRLNQEFAVLGSQYLTELRDKIYCQCNFGPFYDISNNYTEILSSDVENQPTSLQNDPGFFFITDTFYNDTRYTDTDYSVEIREWMKTKPDIGPVQIQTMQETKFEDLNVRLGYPQVYKHFGNCEHVFTLTDIRLLATNDSLKRSDYPMLRIISSTLSKMCMICGFVEACFVIKNSNVHIHEPAYLCKRCMVSYHYVDGKKTGTFQAYRYFGNRPLKNIIGSNDDNSEETA